MHVRVRLRGVVFVLVALIPALTALAYASPPDPTWNAGLYDDDDFDNVVDYITSTFDFVAVPVSADVRPVRYIVALKLQSAVDVVAFIPISAFGPRAPPTA